MTPTTRSRLQGAAPGSLGALDSGKDVAGSNRPDTFATAADRNAAAAPRGD